MSAWMHLVSELKAEAALWDRFVLKAAALWARFVLYYFQGTSIALIEWYKTKVRAAHEQAHVMQRTKGTNPSCLAMNMILRSSKIDENTLMRFS